MARKGRGRLSSIKLLPKICDTVIAWAANELRDDSRTQTDIYQQFYAKLEALQAEHRGEVEFVIPSFSAFNRYSMSEETMTRRMKMVSDIGSAIAKDFDVEKSDDLTVIAAEAIKTLVFELLANAGESGLDPKGAMQLAAALRAAAQAQGVSTARRQKVEKQFEKDVDTALEEVRKEAGLDDATIAKLRRDFLGVKEPVKSDE